MFFPPLPKARWKSFACSRAHLSRHRFCPGKIHLLLFVFFMMCWAFAGCVPKAKVPPVSPEGETTDMALSSEKDLETPPKPLDPKSLIKSANRLYKDKKFGAAFDLYEEYVRRFPDTGLVPAVLMRMSRIKKEMGNVPAAQELLERLVKNHPGSSFAADAGTEMLALLFDAGDYEKLLRHASDLLKSDTGRIHRFKTLLIVGDTYGALGVPVDAVYYYGKALSIARGPEKRQATERLDRVMVLLGPEKMSRLAREMTDEPIQTYLMFQLALNHIEKNRYEEALSLLSELVENHPDVPQAEEAERLLETLNQMAVYQRLTVGCLLPLTGAYAAWGQKALKGVEYALSRFSARPGAPKLHIKVKDTASNDETAVKALLELYDAHVAAVIGPIATVEAVTAVAQEKKIPLLTLTQKEDVAKKGDFIFRNFITPRMQVKALVNYAAGQLGISRFAVLYPDEKYGNTFMNLFWDEVMSSGGQMKGAESYDPSQTDFADSILKLVGLYYGKKEGGEKPVVDFQALFIPDAPSKAGLIVPQLVYHDVENVLLMGTNLWHSEKLLEMAGQYLGGAVLVDGFFGQSDSPYVREFVNGFAATFSEPPGFIEAVTFDTATILFEILSMGDVRFRTDVKKALLSVDNYPGLTGFTSFTPEGDAIKTMYLLQIKNGAFVEIEQVYVE